MKMVAPPYPAQYLKFSPEAARHLKATNADVPDRLFDGVFCFFTPPSNRYGDGIQWTLELIFISQRQDCFSGQVTLLGDTKRDDKPLGEWLNRVLDTAEERSVETFYKPMYAAVSYVVKVFLYMALRQPRSVEHREYDEAMRRYAHLAPAHMARHAAVVNGLLRPTSTAQHVEEGTAAGTKKASRSLVTPSMFTTNSW
jgi:hypothetical protein